MEVWILYVFLGAAHTPAVDSHEFLGRDACTEAADRIHDGMAWQVPGSLHPHRPVGVCVFSGEVR